MSIREFFSKWYRIRDQETVEFAETGVAPEGEAKAMEEAVAEHRHPDEAPADEPDEGADA
jgi:hypothetical protein